MSGQNEQLVDATSCLFEQQKVAPGDKLRNVEHVQLEQLVAQTIQLAQTGNKLYGNMSGRGLSCATSKAIT